MGDHKKYHVWWIIFGGIIVLAAVAAAQTPVGQIKLIADVSQAKPRKITEPTDRVTIKRQTSREREKAFPKMALFFKDRLQVKEYTRVNLRIDNPIQKGNLHLATELTQTHELAPRSKEAIYEIREDPQELGRAAVVVEKGLLLLDWAYGKLSVIASNLRMALTSTKVVLAIDSTGTKGVVFLDEGVISFPDFPDIKVNPKDAYRLQQGSHPDKILLSGAEVAQLSNLMQANTTQLLSQLTPFWQKPLFYIPVATLGVGAATYLIITAGEGTEEDEDLPRPPKPPQIP